MRISLLKYDFRRSCIYAVLVFLVSGFYIVHAQASQKYFGRIGRSEIVTSFAILNNGNQITVGYAWTSSALNSSDAFIMCVDAAGNVIWSKEIATSANDRFLSVTATSDGGCVAVGFAGQSTTSMYSGNHAIAYKFDAAGNLIWNRVLKNSSNGDLFTRIIEIPGSGNLVCAGFYNWIAGANSGLLVNMDNSGNILWAKTYDKTGSDELRDIVYLNGKIIATGFYQGNTYYDGTLLAVDEANGNVLWGRAFEFTSAFSGGNTCQIPSYIQAKYGKIYVDLISTQNYGGGTVRPALIAFDTLGLNPLCLEYLIAGHNYVAAPRSVVAAPDEIYLVHPSLGNNNPWDLWLSQNTTGMTDAAIAKIRNMTATNTNLVYTRRISTAGDQALGQVQIINGDMLGFGSAKNDPGNQIGNQDVFRIHVDTALPVTPFSCISDIPGLQFANPPVSLNPNFTFTETARTFPNPTITPSVTSVNLSAADPCPSANRSIINDYAAILSADTCNNIFTVDDATGFNAGDTVLMIQMKGARIDTSNTAAFGSIINYESAGNYEINVISARSGNNITLQYALDRSYNIPDGKVQFVRVPFYQDYTVAQPHTSVPWNGSKGGIFAIHVAGTLTLNNDIDVSGQGFRGGALSANYFQGCSSMDYYYPAGSGFGGQKGESIAVLPLSLASGRGVSANGGGGGNDHNAGGAGGGNYGRGGRGGDQWNGCPALPLGGEGGMNLVYNNVANKVFLGGGGGGGQRNDNVGTTGTNGGGLVFIEAGSIVNNNRSIFARGHDNLVNAGVDAAGGGGAGGSVLISASAISGTCEVYVTGGRGGDVTMSVNTCHGTGGGGGGGVFCTNTTIPTTWNIHTSGGISGTSPNPCGNHGSTPGLPGGILNNLTIPQSTTPFIKLSAPQLTSNTPLCTGDTLHLGITNTYPAGTTFHWSGPGGFISNNQNPVAPNRNTTHTGTYTSSVFFADCTASDTIHVMVWERPNINLGNDTSICLSQMPFSLQSPQLQGSSYLWSDNSTGTTLTIGGSGYYWLQVTDSNSCINRDTVHINVVTDPLVALGSDTTICAGNQLQIGANIPPATYQWNTGGTTAYIDVSATGVYILHVNLQGCVVSDTIDITVSPLPVVNLGNDTGICLSQIPMVLFSPQPPGSSYLWQDLSTNTSFAVNSSGTYWLQVTDSNSCINHDTVNITIVTDPVITLGNDTTICENSRLQIGTDIPQATYQWNNGSTTAYIEVSIPGAYVLSANLGGCVVSDTIVVTVAPLPMFDLGNDGIICPDETITLDAGSDNDHTYLWSTGATTQTISVNTSGLYIVTVTSLFGCTRSDSILLTDYSYPEVSLGNDTSICEGGWLDLTAEHNYTDMVMWQDGSNSPSFRATQTGVYTVTAMNQCGTASDSIKLITTFCNIWLPNVFTPNGDGQNDLFRILGSIDRLQEVRFSIYNRWGQLIFHTTDKTQGWNGRFKGTEQPVGTYVYLLKYEIDETPHTMKGNFHLIR